MPQRLTQTPRQAGHPLDVNGRPLVASHEQIASILRSRLGAGHGDLLATPTIEADGAVAWSTRLAGEVVPAAALPADERQKIEDRVRRMLGDIRGLGAQLAGEGPAAQLVGQMVQRAAQLPPGDWLYSVGGKPVLAMWGHADPAAPPPPSVPVAAAAPLPAAASAASASAPSAAPPFGGPVPVAAGAGAGAALASEGGGAAWRRRWFWLVPLLLLLALLAFGLKRCGDESSAAGDLASKIDAAEARNKALEAELARRRARQVQYECVAEPLPPPPAASAPEPAPSAPQPAASAPEPAPSAPKPAAPPSAPASQAPPPPPDPYDVFKRKLDAARQDCAALAKLAQDPLLRGSDARAAALRRQIGESMEKNCKAKLITEARNMCPGVRPKELAPELVMVFDASGSMGFSLSASDDEIRQMAQIDAVQGMMRQFGLGRGGPSAVDMERLRREPTRITAARQAAVSVVQAVPSDANIGLVLVDQCPAARSAGYFPPARRGELIGGLQSIQPQQGTPLADGVAKAGGMLDGVNRESVMVVISDGRESCGQDPCAVAAQLARAKPHLKINVVDIMGTGAGNCLAQATGGRVYTARNAAEVAAATRRAAEDAMAPSNCRR